LSSVFVLDVSPTTSYRPCCRTPTRCRIKFVQPPPPAVVYTIPARFFVLVRFKYTRQRRRRRRGRRWDRSLSLPCVLLLPAWSVMGSQM